MKNAALLLFALFAACSGPQVKSTPVEDPKSTVCPAPPIAEVQEKSHEKHGVTWNDPYHWMRQREDPRVISYLEAENSYTESQMGGTEALRKELYDEMLSHIDENELSAPFLRGGYWYYTRNEEGKNYEIHCRKKGSLDAEEQIILDENVLAEGKDYFAVGVLQPSPDGKLIAYSTDELGNERYSLKVLNTETGEHLATEVKDTYYSVAWANDNKTLFYNRVDAATRPYQLWRHELGTDSANDVLVYEEKDEAFFLGVERSRSEKMLLMSLGSMVSTEVHYLDAGTPTAAFKVIAPRTPKVEYYVEHHTDRFYVVSNEEAVNFRLFEAKVADLERSKWKELIPERPDVTLRSVDAFANHLAIWERQGGLSTVRVRDLKSGTEHAVEFPEPSYAAWATKNYTFDTTKLRFAYSSLVTPRSVFDYDMTTKTRDLIKQKNVPNYDPSLYETERINATMRDGTLVPISLVWRKGTHEAGPAPLLLKGYGSYGANYDPYFSVTSLPLLDRGMVIGIAHIRGGGENGRKWYEDGKYLNKKNTFTDFIGSAAHLVALNWTKPEMLGISGRSAGGLLMGAVTNMRPDLFAAVVAGVPFVDVVNTMLDPTIPLTVTEWEEWGNPNDKEYFEYMRSYAPYENVEKARYPHMLVTAGLNDPRVQYWEPAKWVARMRATTEPGNVLLLKTNMGAGHGGASGRYDYLKEEAFEVAFIMRHLGVVNLPPSCD
jgi:oligopeptidase B